MFLDDMKLDLQTGRRPSGVCGAALFIAAHIHGFERSKADVVCILGMEILVLSNTSFASSGTVRLSRICLTLGLPAIRSIMGDIIS